MEQNEFFGWSRENWIEFYDQYFKKSEILNTINDELAARFAQEKKMALGKEFQVIDKNVANLLDHKSTMVTMFTYKSLNHFMQAKDIYESNRHNMGPGLKARTFVMKPDNISKMYKENSSLRVINQHILFNSLVNLDKEMKQGHDLRPSMIQDTIKIIFELGKKKMLRDYFILHPST